MLATMGLNNLDSWSMIPFLTVAIVALSGIIIATLVFTRKCNTIINKLNKK